MKAKKYKYKMNVYDSIEKFESFEDFKLSRKFGKIILKLRGEDEKSMFNIKDMFDDDREGVALSYPGGVELSAYAPDSARDDDGMLNDYYNENIEAFPFMNLTEEEALKLGRLLIKKARQAERMRLRYQTFLRSEFEAHNRKAMNDSGGE